MDPTRLLQAPYGPRFGDDVRQEPSIERRTFMALVSAGLLAAPLAAEAQQAPKGHRIGLLETVPPSLNAANLDALRQGLKAFGYDEGENLIIEYRSADGRPERFPELAGELVRLRVDLIVTRGTPAALAAKHATGSIPIVMASSGDPVATGIVAGLARPGGNVTGLSADATEIEGKRLELLKQILPGASRIAGLFNMGNPVAPPQWKETERGARSLNLHVQLLDVRSPEDFRRAFDTASRQRTDALVVGLDTLFQAHRLSIVELAAKHRLPAIYQSREFVDAGGLIAYAVSYPHMYRRAASFVDRIFKGAQPGDLPIEQPTQFELVINLKTAKALGLTIPQSFLRRADEVIQ
jgi:putative tryptophan/tyrosine transport system substrate-binding protein